MDRVTTAKTIWSSYIRKMSSKALKANAHLTCSSLVIGLRARGKKLDFFANHAPVVFGEAHSPHSISTMSPGTSGGISERTPSEASYASGISGLSKNSEYLAAELAKTKKLLALHGISADDPLVH